MKWRWYSDTFECQLITVLSTNFDHFNHTNYQLIVYLWLSERSWSFERLRFDTALGALPAFPGEGSSLLLGWRFRPLNCTRGVHIWCEWVVWCRHVIGTQYIAIDIDSACFVLGQSHNDKFQVQMVLSGLGVATLRIRSFWWPMLGWWS